MTLRAQIAADVIVARDGAAGLPPTRSERACAVAVNEAMTKVGTPGNNDYASLIQIAALVMLMAEFAALRNKNS